jgi:hypothetical protein
VSRTVFLGVLLLLGARVAIAEPSGREIMEKNFFVSKVTGLQFTATMVLINHKGQQRERKTTNVVKLQPNGIDSKLLVKFHAPADIKGTGFLQVEHGDAEDDLWIYLPALKKSRRLVANNKKDSFVGSDFSYGDIALPKVDQYRHTLLRRDKVDGFDCHVVESIPANDSFRANSGYSKKTTWVRTDNFLETKVEYHDLAGRLLKTQRVTNHQLVEPAKQRWFALRREMTNQQTGHRTVFTIANVDSSTVASDDAFTTRSIERP